MHNVVYPGFIYNTRLGNWLFLIAACYAHAKRNGYGFKIHEGILQGVDKYILRYHPELVSNCVVRQGYSYFGMPYKRIPDEACGNIYGFFQSSRYFSDYEKEIRDLFSNFIYSGEKKEHLAGIHVRMGDYLKLPMYRSPSKEYITKALAKLSKNITDLVVFSDEPEKACDLVKSCNDSFNISVSKETELDKVFQEMTSTNEFIMSCSSFSWWAAYLGKMKKVIVDKKWYNNIDKSEYKDIFEASWYKI